MDIPSHDRILWHACVLARAKAAAAGVQLIADPREFFPLLARGSWINDTNQATIFTSKIDGKVPTANAPQAFFHQLWRLHRDGLMAEMRGAGGALASAAAKHEQRFGNDAGAGTVSGFSSYQNTDHLDIENDLPADELDGWQDRPVPRARTVENTSVGIEGRLLNSTVGVDAPERLQVVTLTEFGRALHSVADFYAHTNYVELLLWSLSWHTQALLDARVIDAFSEPRGFLIEEPFMTRACPLPRNESELKKVGQNAVFWYGPSPEVTPLVSSLFDTRDTAYSLLGMYASRLERTDRTQTDTELNLAMAVFDIPGEPLVRAAYSVLQAFSAVLDGIGRLARRALAGFVEGLGTNRSATERGVLNAAAAIIREYDSAEANDWARAGRLRFVGQTMLQDITQKYVGTHGEPSRAQLPHHTLLAKDHLPHGPEDALRFRLACLLATEATAELITWHFSPDPDPDRYELLQKRYFAHPWIQLTDGQLATDQILGAVGSLYGLPWNSLVTNGPSLVRL